MPLMTIGSKNQIVIPKEVRQKIAGFKAGQVVSIYQLDKVTIAIQTANDNWLDQSFGAMKSAWKKIATDLESLRDEWDTHE